MGVKNPLLPSIASRLAAAEDNLRMTLGALHHSVDRRVRAGTGALALDEDLLALLDGQASQLVKEVARVKALRDAQASGS